MDQDTQLYRVTVEPLTPGGEPFTGVMEWSGMTLTSTGHEFRFRGTEPLEGAR